MNGQGTIGTPAKKGGVKKIIITVLLISVGVHVAAGVIAGIVVVARYFAAPPAEFKAAKDVRLPAKKREQRMNMAAFDAAAPKPTFSDRMQSTRPTAFSLPDVPAMSVDQILPMDASSIISDQVASVADTQGLGATSGALAGGSGGFGGKGFSFLGVESSGQRVLILFDVSTTVENKASSIMPISKIKEKTIELLANLPPTAKFGIIEFQRDFTVFAREINDLVNTGKSNREAAEFWLTAKRKKSETIDTKRGFLEVLEYAATLKPDVVFIITDGSFEWNVSTKDSSRIPWEEVRQISQLLKDSTGKPSKINFIAFQPKPEDFSELRKIAGSNGKAFEMKKE